jgi:PAS domain S-box-containing protein
MHSTHAAQETPESRDLLDVIAGRMWNAGGEAFFSEMVRHLAGELGVRIAMVGELAPGSTERMRSVSACVDGRMVEGLEYDLPGTPCENIMARHCCYYPSGVAQLFPRDKMLAAMGLESYLGAPLIGRNGQALGVLVVLHNQPLSDPQRARTMLQFCAIRVAAELEYRRMVEALREGELRYRTLFDSANDAILVMRQDRFLAANPKALELFGGTSLELIGRSPVELSPACQPDGQESGAKARGLIARALAGESMIFEWKHQRLDGTPFDAEVSLNALDIGGERLLQAMVRDITERKRAQIALQQSEERFKTVFRCSPILMAISKVGGGIVDINDIALQKFGYTREEAVGRTADEIGISIEPAAKIRKEFFDGGMKLRNREIRFRTRSGEVITVLASGELIQLDGQPHILFMAPDITEQKLGEDLMRMLGSAVANAADAILITDANLNPAPAIIYANPAFTRLTGYTSEEMTGGSPVGLFGPSSDCKTSEDILQTLRTWNKYHGEVVNYAKDGRLLYLELDIVPVFDADGKTTHFVAIRRDISHRRMETLNQKRLLRLLLEVRTEEQRRISRELHDHAGQLLTSMLLRLEVLQQSAVTPTVKRAVREISSVASNTLEQISRLARGLHPAVLDDLGLVEALQRTVEEFDRAGISAELRVRGLEERLPQQMEHELYQIVNEALTNVRKHSQAAQVVLSLEKRGAAITVSISDDGVGFDTREPAAGRGGLGLVGMNERAALLGGSVVVESRPQAGTVITVTVPMEMPQEVAV